MNKQDQSRGLLTQDIDTPKKKKILQEVGSAIGSIIFEIKWYNRIEINLRSRHLHYNT